jgi:uncharacterized protein
MTPNLYETIALLVAGVLSGFINALASSGSTVTLPLLILLGIPPGIANGTNRLPIMAGSLMAIYNFNRGKLINWRRSFILTIPLLLGTITGVVIALLLPGKVIGYIITVAVCFALILIVSNVRSLLTRTESSDIPFRWSHFIVFFLIGIWSGLIVLDAASLILIGLVLVAGFEILHANAIKNYFLFVISTVSVIIFSFNQDINWTIGAILSAGSICGAYFGSKFAQHQSAKIWIYRLLIAIVVVEIIQLAWKYKLLELVGIRFSI